MRPQSQAAAFVCFPEMNVGLLQMQQDKKTLSALEMTKFAKCQSEKCFRMDTFFRTAHNAILKNVSEWLIFQNGKQHVHVEKRAPINMHVDVTANFKLYKTVDTFAQGRPDFSIPATNPQVLNNTAYFLT